jgi:hypothetical protein
MTSLRATGLEPIVAKALEVVNAKSLHDNILAAIKTDKFAQDTLSSCPFPPNSRYSISDSRKVSVAVC